MENITAQQVSDEALIAAMGASPDFVTVQDADHLATLLDVDEDEKAPEVVTTENLNDIICRIQAGWVVSALDDESSLSWATMAIPSTEYRRERLTTWIREMGRPAAIDAIRAYAAS